MPNYFAHLVFGQQVLQALPVEFRQPILAQREAFQLGCLGPDPLFFYRPWRPNPVRREGLGMHRATALPVFSRLAEAVHNKRPQALGYAAGFLCHFALDCACHGYVEEVASRGGITHCAMEVEFDRLLMIQAGRDPLRSHLPRIETPQVYQGACAAYRSVGAEHLAEAYRAMERWTAIQAGWCGSPWGRMVEVAAQLPPLRKLRGAVLGPTPARESVSTSARLGELMAATLRETAGELAGFLFAAAHQQPLSTWLDRNFSGRRPDGSTHLRRCPVQGGM